MDRAKRAAVFKLAVRRLGTRGTGRRYPEELKRDALAYLAQGLRRDPLCGDLFLFVSRDRRRAKVLYWDGTGLCVFAKRLERGRFSAPWRTDGKPARLTMSELTLLREGSEMVGKIALSPPPFELRASSTQSS